MGKLAADLRHRRACSTGVVVALAAGYGYRYGDGSAGAVEGPQRQVQSHHERACGFRTHRAVEGALHHSLRRLREPDFTHGFC